MRLQEVGREFSLPWTPTVMRATLDALHRDQTLDPMFILIHNIMPAQFP